MHLPLYGLPESGLHWHNVAKTALQDAGLVSSLADTCLFIGTVASSYVALVLHVDDMLVAASSREVFSTLHNLLCQRFPVQSLGEPTYFSGLELEYHQPSGRLFISQIAYVEMAIAAAGMRNAKPQSTPADASGHQVRTVTEHSWLLTPSRFDRHWGYHYTSLAPNRTYRQLLPRLPETSSLRVPTM